MTAPGIARELSTARAAAWLGALATWLLLAATAHAAVCTVPGSHPSVQRAVNDPTCTEIDLASHAYAESVYIGRSLTVSGVPLGSTVLQGAMRVVGEVVVDLNDLRVETGGADQALLLTAGAEVRPRRVELASDATLPWLFADGFESGDTSAWSSAVN